MLGNHSSNGMLVILEITDAGTELLSRREFIFVEAYYNKGSVLAIFCACTEFPRFSPWVERGHVEGTTFYFTNFYP